MKRRDRNAVSLPRKFSLRIFHRRCYRTQNSKIHFSLSLLPLEFNLRIFHRSCPKSQPKPFVSRSSCLRYGNTSKALHSPLCFCPMFCLTEDKESRGHIEEQIAHIFKEFLASFCPMFCLTEDKASRGHIEEQIAHILKEFLARVAKLEELVTVGSRFLSGFQQGLDFLRRPSLSKTSELVKDIIEANNTKRLQAYVQAGCTNTHDSVQSILKLGTCQCGLRDYIGQAKSLLDELNGLIEDATNAIQTLNEDSLHCWDEQLEASSSPSTKVTDYACMMGIIYCMLKKDYIMQEKIVTSLNLKSSSAELETYCVMWSLRPFINDEILRQAWKLIP